MIKRTCSERFIIDITLLLLSNEVRILLSFFFVEIEINLFPLAQGDTGRVVAFAMGSRCPEPESVSEMGESLLDCHALSLARRAFLQCVSLAFLNHKL